MHNQVQERFLYYFCLIFDFLVPNAGAVAVLIDDLAFVIYGATQAINDFVGGHAVVCNQISAQDIQQVIQSIVHHFYLPPKFVWVSLLSVFIIHHAFAPVNNFL